MTARVGGYLPPKVIRKRRFGVRGAAGDGVVSPVLWLRLRNSRMSPPNWYRRSQPQSFHIWGQS